MVLLTCSECKQLITGSFLILPNVAVVILLIFHLEEPKLGTQKTHSTHHFSARTFRIYEVVQRDTWLIWGDFIVTCTSLALFHNIRFPEPLENKAHEKVFLAPRGLSIWLFAVVTA